MCSYCGVVWRMSRMMEDAAGNFVCPDEGAGLDMVTLSEAEADAAASHDPIVAKDNAGPRDTADSATQGVHLLEVP